MAFRCLIAHNQSVISFLAAPSRLRAPQLRSPFVTKSTLAATPDAANGLKALSDTKVVAYSAMRYVLDFFKGPLSEAFPKTVFTEARLDVQTAKLAYGSDVVVVFVNDVATREVVEQLAAGGVKLIACRCAGFDGVDLQACKEFGIKVVRVPIYSPESIAEHAAALMFCVNRKLHVVHQRVSQGNYTLSGLVGIELFGKTVGVIGTGAIGAHACKVFQGIGMNVLAYDIRENPELLARGIKYTSVEEMLPQCDVISLHCPLLPSTSHIINAERIAKMKDGVLIINVSRGGLIDSDALILGLESGKVGGVGIDVYESEGALFFQDFTMYDSKTRMHHWDRRFKTLLSYPQVLVTPHSAFLTTEALDNIARSTIQNIKDYVSGKELKNEVKA